MNSQLDTLTLGRFVLFQRKEQLFNILLYHLPKTLANNEILIRNCYATICESDICAFCENDLEPIFGHEIVGDILSIQSRSTIKDLRGKKVSVGDRLIWAFFSTPQKTGGYKYGYLPATYSNLFRGRFADYSIIQNKTGFLKINKQIPLKVVAPISYGHVTIAGALNIVGDIKGKRILIFGADLLGLSCSAMCKEGKAIYVGVIDSEVVRLIWANDFGADELFFNKNRYQLPEVDIIFDMTRSFDSETILKRLQLLTTGGIAVWIGSGFPESAVKKIYAEYIVRKGLQVKGFYNYNYNDLINATIFIENNYQKYPFEQIVEQEFSLEMIERAFHYAIKKKTIRVGVKIK
ncbi:MAG: alcohol dehydrogenase catalytic domain-containing protein [Flavobacteriaceae bacterium]|jgi:alcohol dehydrogenase|nr:alcohol dehydrogenase catalytic domain-containing protein [Flavobacteriaceae bacterium]